MSVFSLSSTHGSPSIPSKRGSDLHSPSKSRFPTTGSTKHILITWFCSHNMCRRSTRGAMVLKSLIWWLSIYRIPTIWWTQIGPLLSSRCSHRPLGKATWTKPLRYVLHARNVRVRKPQGRTRYDEFCGLQSLGDLRRGIYPRERRGQSRQGEDGTKVQKRELTEASSKNTHSIQKQGDRQEVRLL